jgi:hypothetical protein
MSLMGFVGNSAMAVENDPTVKTKATRSAIHPFFITSSSGFPRFE